MLYLHPRRGLEEFASWHVQGGEKRGVYARAGARVPWGGHEERGDPRRVRVGRRTRARRGGAGGGAGRARGREQPIRLILPERDACPKDTSHARRRGAAKGRTAQYTGCTLRGGRG